MIVQRLLAMVMAVCLMAAPGCAVHPPQEVVLPVAVPEKYSGLQERTDTLEMTQRWWEIFGDDRLNALMEETFAGNFELSQALARLEQIEALAESTRASSWPFLNIGASGGPVRQPGMAGAVTDESWRLSAEAGFEIDLWQKLKSRRDAAGLDVKASRADLEGLFLSLSARAVELYYLAVEQRAQIRLTDRAIASFADTLELVERRYRSGLVPAVDVYQARQNLAAAKARRPQFESNLAITEHALKVLAGHYPDSREEAGSLSVLPEVIAGLNTGIPSQLLMRRPDIAAALARVQASDERLGAAIAERFPAFNLVGSYGGASSDLDSLLNSGNIFWNLLLNLAQPVIDGGRRRAEVDRSRAVYHERLAAYHQTVLNAFTEVEDALVRGRTTAQRSRFLAERAEASGNALRLSTDRYRQGLTDYLPVLTSQGFYFTAESELLSARRQLISERISLMRALGGHWMAEQVKAARNKGKEL